MNRQTSLNFPPNTVKWLIEKHASDPTYIPLIVGQQNFTAIQNRFLGRADSTNPNGKEFVSFLWRTLNELTEIGSSQNKEVASKMMDHFRRGWKTDKDAFIQNQANQIQEPDSPEPEPDSPEPEPKSESKLSENVKRFKDVKDVEGQIIDDNCKLCQMYFADHDIITLLNCKHVFHQSCYSYCCAEGKPCPKCSSS